MLRLLGENLSCPVDRDRSSLNAFMTDYETGKLLWGLVIESQETRLHDELTRFRLYIDCMDFAVRDWRDLEGKEGFFCLDDIDDPYLYGGASIVILGSHDDVDSNRIRFVRRRGKHFTIEWDGIHEEGWKIECRTEVPFVGVDVQRTATPEHFAWAKDLVGRSLDLSCLGEPTIPYPNVSWFRFPPKE